MSRFVDTSVWSLAWRRDRASSIPEVNELEFKEQLARWRQGSLSHAQLEEVTRLEGKVEKLRTALTDILNLADAVKDHMIDKLLDKDDVELGLEFLLGKRRL